MQKQNYVTLDDSTDFRKLAKMMTEQYGFKMNHATARNNYMKAVKQFLEGVLTELNLPMLNTQTTVNELLDSQDVHDAVYDILYKTYGKQQSSVAENN